MKWEITTKNKKHIVENNSSKQALEIVKETDFSEVLSVKLLPATTMGKIRQTWRTWFGK
jgi:hypothetical protein